MKFFLFAMLALIAICGYLWSQDGPGSGMGWPTGIFSLILVAVLLYKKKTTGSWLSDSAAGR